jgi:2-polyprenyl-6-methoxyphenol hydroxylase-like FAD-dependent oxidoreductase
MRRGPRRAHRRRMIIHTDAVVVGARCAGAPTAMLLARQGREVVLVDRATFPSDTVSTHVLHPPAVATLDRWGLLDRVLASGCPPIASYSFDFGPVTIRGVPHAPDGRPAYAPRRTVLDAILVGGAREAGVDVHEGFTVDEVLFDAGRAVGIRGRQSDGRVVEVRAGFVIGADGTNSSVARAVGADVYDALPPLQFAAYAYWSDLPVDGFEIFIRPDRGMAAVATNDDLTLVVVGWPSAEMAAYKADIEGNYLATIGLVPSLADRISCASRVGRFRAGAVPNQFRQPFGPGWILVGDAGYAKDPITARGIPDAFDDAERVARALDEVSSGRASYDDALGDAHRRRDESVRAAHQLTTELATLAPPPPEMQRLLGDIVGHQPAMDEFVSVIAGSMSPEEFFDPAHLADLLTPVP